MDSIFSNSMQVLAYIGGPILLGILIFYGIRRSRDGQSDALQRVQDSETQRVYAAAETERADKERAARQSSNPVDIIERKTDTTG